MEAEGSLPCSKEPISAPSTEPDEVNPECNVNAFCKLLSHDAHSALLPSGIPASATHLLRPPPPQPQLGCAFIPRVRRNIPVRNIVQMNSLQSRMCRCF
jgi:hypothetical protein